MRNALRWAKEEWAIITRGNEMSASDKAKWFMQWGPFAAKTALYGTISLTAGPLTRDFAASAWAQRRWSESSLRTLGVAIDLGGDTKVPRHEAFVYVCNHCSLLDILVLGAVLPRDPKWVTKRAVMRVPFLGWHLALAGHVPIDRGVGKTNAAQALERFVKVLQDGKPLLIFPEGTRSPSGEMRRFKSGSFRAAVRANVPVVPVVIEGTHALLSKHASHIGGDDLHAVRVRIGTPISPSAQGSEDASVVQLSQHARETMLSMQAQLRGTATSQQAPAPNAHQDRTLRVGIER